MCQGMEEVEHRIVQAEAEEERHICIETCLPQMICSYQNPFQVELLSLRQDQRTRILDGTAQPDQQILTAPYPRASRAKTTEFKGHRARS